MEDYFSTFGRIFGSSPSRCCEVGEGPVLLLLLTRIDPSVFRRAPSLHSLLVGWFQLMKSLHGQCMLVGTVALAIAEPCATLHDGVLP